MREAAKIINDKISQYKQRFKDKDIVDILSMTTLQFAINVLKKEEDTFSESAKNEINTINEDLKSYIEQNK